MSYIQELKTALRGKSTDEAVDELARLGILREDNSFWYLIRREIYRRWYMGKEQRCDIERDIANRRDMKDHTVRYHIRQVIAGK